MNDWTADIIDSLDIIARIDELENEETLDTDEREELTALRMFADEMTDYLPDWTYGETLIRDDYFETYARELAKDIGAIPSDAPWPTCHIDWEAAAEALLIDYTSADLDGVTYWGR
jgi:hypothetical protein